MTLFVDVKKRGDVERGLSRERRRKAALGGVRQHEELGFD
jgi:hypothetical protein